MVNFANAFEVILTYPLRLNIQGRKNKKRKAIKKNMGVVRHKEKSYCMATPAVPGQSLSSCHFMADSLYIQMQLPGNILPPKK